MAIFTTTARPTKTLYDQKNGTLFNEANRGIDGNVDSYGSFSVLSNAYSIIYGGLYFSDIPSIATIKRISIYSKFKTDKKFTSVTFAAVKDYEKGVSSAVDLGDGAVTYISNATASLAYRSKDFPVAATALTADDLRNGVLQVRPRYYCSNSGTFYLYDVYVEVEYEVTDVTLTTTSSPAEGGIVDGGGIYGYGSTATVSAIANSGYAFSHWLVNGGNGGSSNPITLTLTDNASVTAVFEKTSSVYAGSKLVSVYCGTKPVSVYCGTKKLT